MASIRPWPVALTTAALLAVAGCSSGGSGGGHATATPGASTPSATASGNAGDAGDGGSGKATPGGGTAKQTLPGTVPTGSTAPQPKSPVKPGDSLKNGGSGGTPPRYGGPAADSALTEDNSPCPNSGYRLTGVGDAAAGLRVVTVYLTNCGSKSLTLEGYPSVRLQDEDHNRIAKVAVHHGVDVTTAVDDPAPRKITVAPGSRALTTLVWRNLVTDGTVEATTGTYVEMSPAAGRPPQLVQETVDLGTTGKLDVTAWRLP
ncbi:DUF4232 domain-containing protein [Streptomyces sp. CA-111067]|uniref:DUF4232 domain-containing protein n=1 Tax=Streptomyces sp. CA-111067 TaxID=3240046 RepID=UPI003D98C6CB